MLLPAPASSPTLALDAGLVDAASVIFVFVPQLSIINVVCMPDTEYVHSGEGLVGCDILQKCLPLQRKIIVTTFRLLFPIILMQMSQTYKYSVGNFHRGHIASVKKKNN